MAEALEQDNTQTVHPEVEVQARGMGWVPKEEFRGGEDKWIPAEEFVERGQHIMPILRKNNERLQTGITEVRGEVAGLREALKASQAMVSALQESHEEDVQERLASAKAALIRELTVAREAGDVPTEVLVQSKIQDLNAQERTARERKTDNTNNVVELNQPVESPAYKAWAADKLWIQQDTYRRAVATALGIELKRERPGLIGEAFYAALDEKLTQVYSADGGTQRRSKVEEGGGQGGGSGSGAGKRYEDLPADARAACDKMIPRLVGPDRKHKDAASWRKAYTEKYFTE